MERHGRDHPKPAEHSANRSFFSDRYPANNNAITMRINGFPAPGVNRFMAGALVMRRMLVPAGSLC
jgi:hypothetical protein